MIWMCYGRFCDFGQKEAEVTSRPNMVKNCVVQFNLISLIFKLRWLSYSYKQVNAVCLDVQDQGGTNHEGNC